MDEKEIFENICLRLKKILDQNGIPSSRYKLTLEETETYNIKFSHFYKFKSRIEERTEKGGGNAVSQDCNAKDFISRKDQYLIYTETAPERDVYLKRKINNPIQALTDEYSNLIWQSPTLSFRYICSHCSGSGKLTCPSCHGEGEYTCPSCSGRGRNTCFACSGAGSQYVNEYYTDSNGVSQSHSVHKSCSSCYGSGSIQCNTCYGTGTDRCSTCGGSGLISCGTCSGHGFFRDYCTVYLETSKKNRFAYPKNKLYVDEVASLIKNSNNAFFIEKFSPKLIAHKANNRDEYVLEYNGEATVVKTLITLDNKKEYTEAGVNNINAMLYPKLFDYLLLPLASIHHYQTAGIMGYIKNKTFLKGYFQHKNYIELKGNPTIAYAFKRYSESDYGDIEDRKYGMSAAITSFTGELISTGSSDVLAGLALKTINAISPYTTNIVWWMIYLLVIAAESYTTFTIFKNFIFYKAMAIVSLIFIVIVFGFAYLLITYFVTFGFIAPIGSLINQIITKSRQLKADKEHRPKVHNRSHLQTLFKINFFTYAVMIVLMYVYNLIDKFSFMHKTVQDLGVKSDLVINRHSTFLDILVGKKNMVMVDNFLSNFNAFTVKSVYDMTIWFNQIGIHVTRVQVSITTVLVIILVPFLYFYFLPSLIAFKMKSEKRKNILIKNIFLVPFLLFTPWLYLLYTSLN